MTPAIITLVSTHTIDRLPTMNGIQEIPGGPARYVGEALERLECPFRLITGERALVEVLSIDGAEEYRIPPLAPIAMPERLEGEAVILSPIIGEIDPANVPPIDGLLVVDLQGFVRQPGRPTHTPRKEVDLLDLVRRADVVKGSRSEMTALDSASRKALDGCILAVTQGAQGAIIVDHGHEYSVSTEPVDAAHTIGAG